MSYRARELMQARGTLALLGAILVVGALLEMQGGVEAIPEAYLSLGLSRAGLGRGHWWQPFSYPFVHGNGLHLMINAVSLLVLGPRLERIGGTGLLLRVFAGGCLLGGAVHLLATPVSAGGVPLVGASGGIVSALLWLTAVSPEARVWPLPVSGRSLGLGILLSSAILALMNPELGVPVLSGWGGHADTLIGGYLFQASHACHFGGAVAGWAWGRWAMRPRVSLETLRRERARREAGGATRRPWR